MQSYSNIATQIVSISTTLNSSNISDYLPRKSTAKYSELDSEDGW